MNFQSAVRADRQSAAPAPGVRRLAPALAASVILHLLVLWPAALPRAPLDTAHPISATLRPQAVPVASAPPDSPSRPAPAAVPTAKLTQEIDTERPAPFAVAPAAPEPAPRSAAPEAGPAPAGAGRNAVQLASLSADAAGAAPGDPVDGVDAEGIRAYRIGLARGARAHKRYPVLARERGWSGTAEVRVDVSGEGRPRQVQLARSSGHELLDREAVAMLARAASAASVPASLRGREFAVSLPVVFDLADTE